MDHATPLAIRIDREGPLPMATQLQSALKRQIDSGELPHGTQLPSMRQLSDQASVGFSVVRQAVNKLTEEGYLRVDSRRGVFVSRPRVSVRDIAIVIPLITQYYFNRLLKGVHEGLVGTEYRMVVELANADWDEQIGLLERLDRAFVAGVIIAPPPFQRHAAGIQKLLDRGLPCVQVSSQLDQVNAPAVVTDEHEMGRQATQMLIDAGHRRIARMDNNDDSATFREMRLGIHHALTRIGLDLQSIPVIEIDANRLDEARPYAKSIEAAEYLLDTHADVTGVVCCSLNRAIGLYTAATRRGLRVPDDLSIVSLGGDLSYNDAFNMPLTTFDRPTEAIGRRAAVLIQRLVEGHTLTSRTTQLAFRVTDRGSVGPPRA